MTWYFLTSSNALPACAGRSYLPAAHLAGSWCLFEALIPRYSPLTEQRLLHSCD